jgi:riboflavin biosynthesis pyrimidine reductase
MPVVANIVLGKDGATTSKGNSAPLSSGADRERFHQLRKATDLIVIGGETSRREPYRKTPAPLAVVSRRELLSGTAAENPQAFLIRGGIGPALLELQSKYTSILLECGARLLSEALALNLIDDLYITQTNTAGEGPYFLFETPQYDLALVSEESSETGEELFRHYARLPRM